MKKISLFLCGIVTMFLFSACDNDNEPEYRSTTGNVMFWASQSEIVEEIVVQLETGSTRRIKACFSSTPSCGTKGCATFNNLEAGTYSYYAYNSYYSWSGNITVYPDKCMRQELVVGW